DIESQHQTLGYRCPAARRPVGSRLSGSARRPPVWLRADSIASSSSFVGPFVSGGFQNQDNGSGGDCGSAVAVAASKAARPRASASALQSGAAADVGAAG